MRMDKKMIKEILAAHADQLVNGRATSEDYLKLLPDRNTELEPLLSVAEQLQSALRPISPPNKFERDLKQELLTTAQRHQLEGYRPPSVSRDLLVLFATLTFIFSLGLLLIVMRRKLTQSAQDQAFIKPL